MNSIEYISTLITEDPNILQQRIVIAVHPNHVVDAASAASSIYGQNPEIYGPKRLNILLNYIERFKSFINSQIKLGFPVIVTMLNDPPSTVNSWYDSKLHWEKPDIIKQGMEQEQVHQAYQDLMDFIHANDVHVVVEARAGDACKDGRLKHFLDKADEVILIGGNLTGCLASTLENLKAQGVDAHVIEGLTFDDDPSFWGRSS